VAHALPSGARSPLPGLPYPGVAATAYPGAASPPAAGGYTSSSVPPPFPSGTPHSPFHVPPGGLAPGASFLNLFGDSQLTLQEIADKARQLQQKIDENAEHEKANLRAAAEQKHQEIERHAAELARHAAGSIEAYKTTQLQTAERQKAYQQAVVRQQAEQAKRLIDQQAAQAIAAVETRDRHIDLQRQTQELGQHPSPLAGQSYALPSPMDGFGSTVCAGAVPPSPPHLSGLAGAPTATGATLDPSSSTSPAVAMFQSGVPVTAADAERCGSLGAAAASQLQGSESYTAGLRRAALSASEGHGPPAALAFGGGGYGGSGVTLPPAACCPGSSY